MIKVQLIVVQGKPEGKTIPLTVPVFRIGRDPSCHLRPSSDQVSRNHSEITITSEAVILKDLGSRNGTILNGKPIAAPTKLKPGDLVKIGHLTFAVSIQGAPLAASEPAAHPGATTPQSLDEVPQEQVESWLIADHDRPIPDRPSGVYDGETITIAAYRENQAAAKPPSSREMPAASSGPPSSREIPAATPRVAQPEVKPPSSHGVSTPSRQPQAQEGPAPPPVPTPTPAPAPSPAPTPVPAAEDRPRSPDPEPEDVPEAGAFDYLDDLVIEALPEGEAVRGEDAPTAGPSGLGDETDEEEESSDELTETEFFDESNPFYAARKKPQEAAPEAASSGKKEYQDSSSAANDILKKMLERRRNR